MVAVAAHVATTLYLAVVTSANGAKNEDQQLMSAISCQ